MIYLIEPYNAHQKPPRKKHWTEIAEEEALLVKTQLEHQRLEESHRKASAEDMARQIMDIREAHVKSSLSNQNIALPQYEPQPAAQQVQDGQYAAPAGGGGWVIPTAAEADEIVDFLVNPNSGVGPLLVSFINLMPTPENDTFLWQFGSGSLTSTAVTPPDLTYTQTGSYTVTLHATSSVGATSKATKIITVSDPTIFAWISSPLLTSGVAPVSRTYTISNSGTAPNATVTGWFDFGDGTTKLPYTASGMNSMTFTHIYQTGSFTASLALTESGYNHRSSAQVYVTASLPVLIAGFTFNSASAGAGADYEPMTASFTASVTYNGSGILTQNWSFTSASTAVSNSVDADYVTNYWDAGPYTASLAVTESSYGRTSRATKYFVVQT